MKRLTTIATTATGLLSILLSGCGGCSSSNSRQLNAQSDSIMQILEQRYIDDALTATDYAVADSIRLCCHDADDRYNYAKTLLFLGDILQTANDYAEAIDHYREAYDVASALNDHQLVVWACQGAGDLLFAQRMLDESVVWYRCQSEAAQQWGDTLRMAYAAFRMGKALTVEGCADSAAYYYQRAIALAEPLPQAYRIVPAARYKLCDLYIQTHRFEEARQLMTRDTIDDENWAYWHWGQGHADSAAYYLRQMIGRYGLHADADYLRTLAAIETSRGRQAEALNCYQQLLSIDDSIRLLSKTEEIRRAEAHRHIADITEQRNLAAQKGHRMQQWLLIMTIAFVAVVSLLTMIIIHLRQKHRLKDTQMMLLNKEMEQRRLLSSQRIEEIDNRLDELSQLISTSADKKATLQLKLEKSSLEAERVNVERHLQQSSAQLNQFEDSELYHRIMHYQGDEPVRLNEEEWTQLVEDVDQAYDHFATRLKQLVRISPLELRVCCLVKMGVEPSRIAQILFKSRSDISVTRRRLYSKIMNQNGSAAQMDEFIRNY